jgi:hypothetical protein
MDSLDVMTYRGYLLRQKKPSLVELMKLSTGESQTVCGSLDKSSPDMLVLHGKWKGDKHD